MRGASKRTDMCHYCVNGKKSVAQLERLKQCENDAEAIRSKIEKVFFFYLFI